MRRLALLLCCLATPAWAQIPPILQALRRDAWAVAHALAARNPDPLADRLVSFIRLLDAHDVPADDVQAFLADNPTWPDRGLLERRYAAALADEPDARVAARLCQVRRPWSAPALGRCAEAFALTGQPEAARRAARDAWVLGIDTPAQEADFLARWGDILTPSDQQRRFTRLEAADPDAHAAQRQLARLAPPRRAVATALLALRLEDPAALTDLAAVPPKLRAAPDLLLAQARYLRRTHDEPAAMALWRSALFEAEAATPVARRGPFWAERAALSRQMLSLHQPQAAYDLANDTDLPTDDAIEADFWAGWLTLRAMHMPAAAQAHFQALAAASPAVITQARAYYWLGRAAPTQAAAQADYRRASAWPFTYYGQLAARAAGESEASLQASIAAAPSPAIAQAAITIFDSSEMARAARILVGWGDPRRADDFLRQLLQTRTSLDERAMAADLARRLGLPEISVLAARLAGRDGATLPQAGWPAPFRPPPGPVPPALMLALMRQESSFTPWIVSAAGAQGLMQLMPATAAQMAHSLHLPAGPLDDPTLNMRLGEAYFARLLARFAGVVPYAVAAYNAGPHRVQGWVAASDAAATGDAAAMIDWMELIPYEETRGYVQRVLESVTVYAARGEGK